MRRNTPEITIAVVFKLSHAGSLMGEVQ
jgi:hypothetical protein